jgi:hypothetical protein
MNPEAPSNLYVLGDSLYYSFDSGSSWATVATPEGSTIGQHVAPDWRRNYLVVLLHTVGPDYVYCLNLDLLE